MKLGYATTFNLSIRFSMSKSLPDPAPALGLVIMLRSPETVLGSERAWPCIEAGLPRGQACGFIILFKSVTVNGKILSSSYPHPHNLTDGSTSTSAGRDNTPTQYLLLSPRPR